MYFRLLLMPYKPPFPATMRMTTVLYIPSKFPMCLIKMIEAAEA